MRDSTAVYDDSFFADNNSISYNASNTIFEDCVKFFITFEVLLTFSALRLKNSAGLSLNSP
jgi:hypothetical protein